MIPTYITFEFLCHVCDRLGTVEYTLVTLTEASNILLEN